MSFRKDLAYNKRIKKTSYKTAVDESLVKEIIELMYEYIYNKLHSIEAERKITRETPLTEQEFNNKFPVVHIPSLGFLKPNYRKYLRIQEKLKAREKNKTNNKTNA